MFAIEDFGELQARVDAVPIPMFIADRDPVAKAFRLLCVNAAHEVHTGIRTEAVKGLRPFDLLPADQAAQVEARYAACADSLRSTEYMETLTMNGQGTTWHTTLYPICMPCDSVRIVGTSVPLSQIRENWALQDTAYFAALAQMQLTRVSAFVSQLEDRRDLPPDVAGHAIAVSGLCRSLHQVLEDMRASGEQAQGSIRLHSPPPCQGQSAVRISS